MLATLEPRAGAGGPIRLDRLSIRWCRRVVGRVRARTKTRTMKIVPGVNERRYGSLEKTDRFAGFFSIRPEKTSEDYDPSPIEWEDSAWPEEPHCSESALTHVRRLGKDRESTPLMDRCHHYVMSLLVRSAPLKRR